MLSIEAIRYYSIHPVEFVYDIIGAIPDDKQAEILNSVVNNPMTTVRSGHGIGKSTVEAWAVIWFLVTHPYPKIPCTAPTQHQLYDILWAEISKWKRNNKILDNELVWTKEKLYMKGHSEEWFAVARTASMPDALQGFHAEHMLYIIDEASGVDDTIFEPVLGALSTPGARLLMCGNPTRLSGFFYDSHTKLRDKYYTLHVDGRKSSRVSAEFVQTIIDMYGIDSNVFRVRVAGDFPDQEDDVFIPLKLVEQCSVEENTQENRAELPYIIFGVDVARFGDDETIIYRNAKGRIKMVAKRRGQDLMSTVGDIVVQYKNTVKEFPEYRGRIYVNIDDTGLGGGVTDRLREVKKEQKLKRLYVIPINASEKIETDTKDGEEAAEHYNNITTHMWAVMKDLMKNKEIVLEEDQKTFAQISSRKYFLTSSGKIELESKKEMKKRGLESPDRADALALSVYLGKIKKYTGSAPNREAIFGLGKESYWRK